MAKTHKAVKGNGSTGNSPIASLASRATTESATAAPKSSNVKPIKNFTGQFWFDRFVKQDGKEEQTRLDLVRQAAQAIDTASLKSSLDDMVEYASKADESEGWTGTKKNKGPTYKTASNTRSVIQKCYGALRFADDELKAEGYTEKTGFHAFAIIAKKALDKKEIKWNGEKGVSAEERVARKQHKQEEVARARIMKATPRQVGEDFVAYNERVLKALKHELEQMDLERTTETIDTEVSRLLEHYGPEMAKAIGEAVIAATSAKPKKEAKAEAESKAESKAEEMA